MKLLMVVADEYFMHEQVAVQVTISLGVTPFTPPGDERGGGALLAAADAALYEAKAAGRNRTVFTQSAGND
ncbi:MAG: diguanylate cyclase [Pseudomonadota bacterium]